LMGCSESWSRTVDRSILCSDTGSKFAFEIRAGARDQHARPEVSA
jgi:hypothetical protein